MAQSREITFGGLDVLINKGAYAHPLARLANQYVHPLGPAYGVGYLLMRYSSVEMLTRNAGGPHTLKFETEGDGANKVTINGLYIERAVRLAGGSQAEDPNGIYGVRVVDKRYALNRFSVVSNADYAFNVRAWAAATDFVENTLKPPGDDPRTVEEIITVLWDDLPTVAGSLPTFPAEFDDLEIPENLYFAGRSAWRAINDLLEKYGYALKLHPSTGIFSAIKLGDEGTEFDYEADTRAVLYDARAAHSGAVAGPATIRVFFPRRLADFGLEADHSAEFNFITTNAYHSIDKATGLPNALGGTVLALWDSTSAIVAHGGAEADAPENLTELEAVATKRKDAWLAKHSLGDGGVFFPKRRQIIYPGLVQAYGQSNLRRMIWRDFGGRPGQAGLVTELIDMPGLDRDCDPAKGGGSIFGDEESDENFKPIDFARPGPPVYPRTANMIRLIQDDSPPGAGEEISAVVTGATGEGTIFSGQVIFVEPGSAVYDVREPCWVVVAESFAEAVQDEIRFGRLMGVYVLGEGEEADRRPLYMVEGSAGRNSGIIIGEVDSAGIAANSIATVQELNADGTPYQNPPGIDVFFTVANVFTSAIGGNRRILASRWRRNSLVEIAIAEDCPS